jgi:energy-coupling factor transporter ATP-binding protein EcfA2
MAATTANSTTNTTGADGAAIAFPSNPFVGLRPFNSGEALLFFGRGEQTVELLRRLHRDHFIAVVGSSGCGKSSLVRAGLIPKLRAGFLTEDRDRWLMAAMKPGDALLRNLAAALIEGIPAGGDVEVCAEAIRAGGAQAVIEQLSPSLAHSDANLLLLVDQFEEIFRFGVKSGKQERQAEAEDFVSIMLALAEQRRLPIYVVMTMRSDFLGDCDLFHGLPEAMNRGQYLVPRLTRQQRQQAVEGPSLLFGASISPRLLDRLLNEVGDKSDQLPVMQHALMRTWEKWQWEATERRGDGATGRDENPQSQSPNSQSIQVDLPHYEAAGGIKNALSKDAEAALDGLGADELKIAERMFQALTDTDALNRRFRHPAHLSEIVAITGADPETVLKIIERFRGGGRSFLTVSNDDDPLIDISHESLIRQWDRMSEWVQTEAESRDMYLRVADAARIYHKHGRKRDLLWSGTQLQLASKWRKERAPTQQWAEQYDSDFSDAMGFLARSRSAESRRSHLFWSVISMAFIALLGLTNYAWRQQRQAIRQEQFANQFYYTANMNLAQEDAVKKDSSRFYQLLNAFLPSPENGLLPLARDFYWYHLWRSTHQETATLKGHGHAVISAAFSPNGKTLASGSEDKTVKLWYVATRQNVTTLKGQEISIRSVAFSPDGATLTSAGGDVVNVRYSALWLWLTATDEDVARQRSK